MDHLPKNFIFLICFLLLGLIGFLDLITSPLLSFRLFYLIPVLIACWYLGWQSATIVSLLSFGISIFGHISFDRQPAFLAWGSDISELIIFQLIIFLIDKLKGELEVEKQLSQTDALTGIMNRRYFLERAVAEVTRAQRYGHNLSLAFIDVDNFKKVNDEHGHDIGDQVLRKIGQGIKCNVRQSDLVGRFGGDEFAILFPEADKRETQKAINKTIKNLNKLMKINGWKISFSVGVANYTNGCPSVDQIIKEADKLMYTVKKNGKDRAEYQTFHNFT